MFNFISIYSFIAYLICVCVCVNLTWNSIKLFNNQLNVDWSMNINMRFYCVCISINWHISRFWFSYYTYMYMHTHIQTKKKLIGNFGPIIDLVPLKISNDLVIKRYAPTSWHSFLFCCYCRQFGCCINIFFSCKFRHSM